MLVYCRNVLLTILSQAFSSAVNVSPALFSRYLWLCRLDDGGWYRGIYLEYLLLNAHNSLAPAMAQRVTLRKRNPYNTKSNLRRVVKTPGGQLVYHHLKKRGTAPKCGDCGIALPGVCF